MNKYDIRSFATLLAYQAENRGNESWGFVKVKPDKIPTVVKGVDSIRKVWSKLDLNDLILSNVVLGHTRKATTGKVSQRNAHPFTFGNIVGSHNGFIYQHEQLNKEHSRDFEVDSEHLIAHIAEGKPLKSISGMGTVSYINLQNPAVVYLGRGQGSDLAVRGIGDPDKPIGVVWASVENWLDNAMDMAGIDKFFSFTTKYHKLYAVKDYNVHEEGEFDLTSYRGRDIEIIRNDKIYIPHNYGYRGHTFFDNKDYDKERNKDEEHKPLNGLTKTELDALPEHLKKKIKKSEIWRLGKQRKLLRQLGNVMRAKIGEQWLPIMRRMLGE